MIEFELPDLGPYFFITPLIVLGCYLLWPHSRQRREQWATRWAQQNLVQLTPEISAAVVTNTTIASRVTGAITLLTAAIAAAIGLTSADGDISSPQLWALVVSLGALVSAAGIWRMRSPWLHPSTTRAAHVRSTRLSDYVPPSLRWGARTAAALCLISAGAIALTAPASLITATGWSTLIPAGTVIAALIVAEWSGRVAAARPQPARDVVELYAQDAWRTGLARQGFQGVALWGGVVLNVTVTRAQAGALLANTTHIIGIALILWAVIALANPLSPIQWTRRRLWPTLRPDEWVSATAVTL